MNKIKPMAAGLILTLAIALMARYVAPFVPLLGGVALALVTGIIVGNTIRPGATFELGIGFSERQLLSFAVMLMGFKLQLGEMAQIGPSMAVIVVPTIFITLAAAVPLGRIFGYSKRFSLLMGSGNVICGTSAIAATAPVVEAKQDEIGISIGIVNLLGTIGMFLMPGLAAALAFSDHEAAYLIGGSLQAVGHVVASGFSVSESVGDMSTLVKMFRVLMLGPVVILIPFLFRLSGSGNGKRQWVPGYIIGFIVCSIAGTLWLNDTNFLPYLKELGKMTLMMAMAGIGLKIQIGHLIRQAPKALVFGGLVGTLQLAILLIMILWMG